MQNTNTGKHKNRKKGNKPGNKKYRNKKLSKTKNWL